VVVALRMRGLRCNHRLSGLHAATVPVMTASELVRVRRLASTGAARVIREDAGLSLSELAEAVDVHKVTVFRWEHNQRKPRGEAARRYLQVLEELANR
jgi:DNA-binding transcriptional regulator YiaG